MTDVNVYAAPPVDLPAGSGLLDLLDGHGSATAVVAGGEVLSYADLAARVRARAERLGGIRRLVMVEGVNEVEPLVTYLAAMSAGHPVLMVPGGNCLDESHQRQRARIASAYQPDVVLTRSDGDWTLREVNRGTRHALHPDLALLLSTSGSTGSPKLVRLSHRNVRSNAASIASYLRLSPDDCAATTLPMHYCYGLSVVNSHLAAGASLLLTERSVVDEEFWREFRAARATSLAGVPYTFDLLDASGFAERDVPSLRYLTQAGGRLTPERVRDYARLGEERGFDFVVMYGATEATARMAYLPPHLATTRPETIGIPIPGGNLRIEPIEDSAVGSAGGSSPSRWSGDSLRSDRGGEIGELVYSGPNVMMGYAERPADLALGRTVDDLHTGDLAVQHADGLFEVVGRRTRMAKVYGLRVDLDRVERLLQGSGVTARAVAHADRLAVFVTKRAHVAVATQTMTVECGLPAHVLGVRVVEALPVNANGKPDYAALARQAALTAGVRRSERAEVTAHRVRDLYAELLGRPDATVDDSFVALRGDSLSYVELSVRLADLLGSLPRDWPALSPQALVEASPKGSAAKASRPAAEKRPARWGRLEMPVLLRALAILLIVGTHANVTSIMGGAHVLLALAGFNIARFHLADVSRGERLRSLSRAVRQLAVPTMLWTGLVAVTAGTYALSTVLLLNNLLGSDTWTDQWQFWFIEAVVWSLLGVGCLAASARVDSVERRHPWAFAVALVAGTLAMRYLLVGIEAGPTQRYAAPVVLWCIALGWLIARAQSLSQRIVASSVVLLSVTGFFGEPVREALIACSLLLLAWTKGVAMPRPLARLLGTVAAASLWVYLTHWQIYPSLEMEYPYLAMLASFVVGIVAWRAYAAGAQAAVRHLGRLRSGQTADRPRRRAPRVAPAEG